MNNEHDPVADSEAPPTAKRPPMPAQHDIEPPDYDTVGPFRLDGGPDGRSRLDVAPLGED